jgi:hypothetical protein
VSDKLEPLDLLVDLNSPVSQHRHLVAGRQAS